ncbi:DUF5518 domain-containing protein [Halobiforma nitratireducens]|uniref:DUF5518 domain-containing protein n=1 Tax=Halobiforma nitratireducens JCM 10879 TaxID=1227454 RepID=M0LCM9_9EURY|nr:DUF5518 domain-containing protein [Halobiforma nitratireducens]EMA31322.1 hypothetical protein C446_15810 [Halobiforma nitratireducens JCM 10879]
MSSEPATPSRPTLVNGSIGGVVALVLSFVPFASLLGGLVAGYLEGQAIGSGFAAGIVAGIVYGIAGYVLFLLFGGVMLGFLGVPMTAGLGGMLLFAIAFVLVYALAFAAAGGAIGAYLNREFGDEIGRY